MAGFFGLFDYNKEGPGVYLNEPPKGPFKTFFSILGRKFWKIITINMMYVVFSIPALILVWIVTTWLFPSLFPLINIEALEKFFASMSLSSISENVSQAAGSIASQISSAAASVSQAAGSSISQASASASEAIVLTPKESAALLLSQIILVCAFALTGLQLVVLGPVHAGVTYLFRNYAREEHAFLWGDFKEHLSKNWKQSALTSLIGVLAVVVISVNYSFYTDPNLTGNTFLKGILSGIVIILSLIFTIMQMYIYPMMVTFKLSIRQLYKNSALLAMARLPFNIGILLVSALILLVIPAALILFIGGIGIVLGIFYYFFIAFGLNLMVTNFFVYRQLKKYMIDPMKSAAAKEAEAEPKEEPIFSDKPQDEDREDKGE